MTLYGISTTPTPGIVFVQTSFHSARKSPLFINGNPQPAFLSLHGSYVMKFGPKSPETLILISPTPLANIPPLLIKVDVAYEGTLDATTLYFLLTTSISFLAPTKASCSFLAG